MQKSKNRTAAIMIATLLIVSMSASMILLPTASAHNPAWQCVTHAYVQAMPDTVGVGQTATVYMWIDYVFPGSTQYNLLRWHNYKLTITDPSGAVTTKTFDIVMDTTSNQGYTFTPTIVGDYQLQFNFPGQDYTSYAYTAGNAAINDTYLPSNATGILHVTQDPVPALIDSYPFPTEYWTRPIYAENPIWWMISSNWLGVGSPGYGGNGGLYTGSTFFKIPTDSVGPLTSHVMWTKELTEGGVVGGNNYVDHAGNTWFEGSAYQQRFTNPIIVDGKIVYNGQSGYLASKYHTYIADLRTGEILVDDPTAYTFSFAYIPDFENGNQHGVAEIYLCTANFAQVYDMHLVNKWNATGVPSGYNVAGPNGEFLKYIMNTTQISQWNSTKMWVTTGNSPVQPSATVSQAASTTTCDFYGVQMTYNGANFTVSSTPTVRGVIYGDMILAFNGTTPTTGASSFIGTTPTFRDYTYFAVNLNASRGPIGQVMWIKNVNPITDSTGQNATVLFLGWDGINKVFVEGTRETNQFKGYDMYTGAQIWGLTAGQGAMDYYGSQSSGTIENAFAFGNMYVSAYDGIVYCYNTKNGNLEWTYGNGGTGNSTQSYFEVPGRYPTFVSAFGNNGGDNKVVYTITSEHTIETPVYKGAMARCLNATTGEEIWKLNSYVTEFSANSYAVADGYAVWYNSQDSAIYSVGRGPSQLSVSAPQTGIELGKSLVISGNVYDVSAGSKQNEQSARFASGLPVAADSCMTDWMGYVYQQKPLPSTFQGVTVDISVIDANGNFRSIGTATTDAKGNYNLKWTPDIAGQFSVVATFAGTQAYFPSSDTTAFSVDPAPVTPTPAPTSAPSTTDQYFIPAVAAIIVVIIVCFLATVLALRKHP